MTVVLWPPRDGHSQHVDRMRARIGPLADLYQRKEYDRRWRWRKLLLTCFRSRHVAPKLYEGAASIEYFSEIYYPNKDLQKMCIYYIYRHVNMLFKDAKWRKCIRRCRILNLSRVQHVVEFDFKRPHKKTSSTWMFSEGETLHFRHTYDYIWRSSVIIQQSLYPSGKEGMIDCLTAGLVSLLREIRRY